ncbi:MAG: glycosyltransferase, partial [Dehalococcoidia bacterium]|nr:glycosyltransferase [Dehalococcoidia bacterium]
MLPDRNVVKVSVIIPAWNEEPNLVHVLPRIPAWIHEEILVDGGSTDGTRDTARRLWPTRNIESLIEGESSSAQVSREAEAER